tara:strand:- start:618 stop:791 length:174 start_codon:yes stop_codon:yes gene_type:complete
MKLTESRIKQIILEEIQAMSEEDMSSKTLEPKAVEILKQLPAEEQAVVNQYIASLKG